MNPLTAITRVRCKDALERAGFVVVREVGAAWVLAGRGREVTLAHGPGPLDRMELHDVVRHSGLTGPTFWKLVREPAFRLVDAR